MFDGLNIFFGRNVKWFKTIAPIKIKKKKKKKKILILLTEQEAVELNLSVEHFLKCIFFLKNV